MPDKNTSQVGELDSAPFQLEPNPSHHILVVDDEPDIRQLSTEVLTDSGYAVDAAEDGAVAWQALNTDSYDLLITDHNIPKVSGVELLKKMRAARMNLPVIMATGNLPAHEFARKPWLKPDAMLHKPYTVAEMLKTVKKVLREADSIADSSHLFKFKYRDMNDNKISQAEEPLGAPLQYPINSPHRILVVDDNSDVRQFSVDVLVGSGYDVEAAKDGLPQQHRPHAVDAIRERIERSDDRQQPGQSHQRKQCARKKVNGHHQEIHDQLETLHVLQAGANGHAQRGKQKCDQHHESHC